MLVSLIANPDSAHQVWHQKAIGKGLRKIGIQVVESRMPVSDIVACWGWRLGKMYRDAGHDVIVMERGYLGDRFKWTSICWNGLNGRGEFPEHDDPSRFEKHFKLKPWKDDGRFAVVMGQVPRDQSLAGRDLNPWYREMLTAAERLYGIPARFRPHPLSRDQGRGLKIAGGTLDEVLDKAGVVITFNSNSAVDAVIAGVPSIAVDEGSMAWEVSGHKVGQLAKPDRENWAHRLAWKQWRVEEIESGQALEGLFEFA